MEAMQPESYPTRWQYSLFLSLSKGIGVANGNIQSLSLLTWGTANWLGKEQKHIVQFVWETQVSQFLARNKAKLKARKLLITGHAIGFTVTWDVFFLEAERWAKEVPPRFIKFFLMNGHMRCWSTRMVTIEKGLVVVGTVHACDDELQSLSLVKH